MLLKTRFGVCIASQKSVLCGRLCVNIIVRGIETHVELKICPIYVDRTINCSECELCGLCVHITWIIRTPVYFFYDFKSKKIWHVLLKSLFSAPRVSKSNLLSIPNFSISLLSHSHLWFSINSQFVASDHLHLTLPPIVSTFQSSTTRDSLSFSPLQFLIVDFNPILLPHPYPTLSLSSI